jgi:RIO-like serine/threonine protein kinase
MAALAGLNKDEAERLTRKFHRCGHTAEQRLDETRRAVKDAQVHAHISFDIETCAVEGTHKAYAIAGTVRGGESRRFTANDDDDQDIAKRFLDWCMEMADRRYTHADIQAKRNRTVVLQAHNLKYDLSGVKHLLSKFKLVELSA